MLPLCGSRSLTMERPSVLFPHPDSPTSPTHSPLSIEKLTFRTASKCFFPLANPEEFSLYRTVRSSTSSTGVCITLPFLQVVVEVARDVVLDVCSFQHWFGIEAVLLHKVAAIRECASCSIYRRKV